mgnify:FL=1|tara:strand:- start:310 stop:753 length:444 start_codon:yes stop_codon:yes gene_type:complete
MAVSRKLEARRKGFRSVIELKLAEDLQAYGKPFSYEKNKIEWEDLAYRSYTPDFITHNNIIIEAKGRFMPADRRKHLAIKKQYPHLDVRFVFENSNKKLYKGAKSTYAQWCYKYDFRFYDKKIPKDWLQEKTNPKIPTRIPFIGKKK